MTDADATRVPDAPAAAPDAVLEASGTADPAHGDEGTDRLELIAAIVLALATVVATWSAYQATRWSGKQANDYSLAAARRTDAAQETSLFAAEALIDVQIWLSWVQLRGSGEDAETAAFLQERFRDEFKPAFDAWLAQVAPGKIPPGTPFDMEEYESATAQDILRLHEEAEALFEEGRQADRIADNFVLNAVIMAGVLFFAGVGTRFRERRIRRAMLGLAIALLVGGVAFMSSMPQSVAV